MKFGLRHIALMLLWSLSFVVMPTAAMANELHCDTDGRPTGQILPVSGAAGNGSLTQDTCSYSGIQHIVSQIVCDFVTVVNDVLGNVYCGIQHATTPILELVLSLYIGIFGIQLFMGQAQLNTKDILVRLLKIAGVWTFATESAMAVNMGFDFFMSFMTTASMWVLQTIHIGQGADALEFTGNNGVMPLYKFLDDTIYSVIAGPVVNSKELLLGFMIGMMAVYPPIFMLALCWLYVTLDILRQAIVSFMLGVSAIAFLISLSPIFMSFMLFQATYQFFENWLKYMISYALQIVIVFACIAMWINVSLTFAHFFDDLGAVVFQYQKVVGGNTQDTPANTWGICPYDFTNTTTGPHIACKNSGFDIRNQADRDKLLGPTQIPKEVNFLYFIIYYFFSLILIGYAFSVLMKNAPSIAQQLAGPSYVPILGQGYGSPAFGEHKMQAPSGMGAFNRMHGVGSNALTQLAGNAIQGGASGSNMAPPVGNRNTP
jgi:type IV secretory pathway VirB6-like protein